MNISLYNRALLQLSLIKGIGPVAISAITRAFKKEELYDALERSSASLLQERVGLTARVCQMIAKGMQDSTALEQELNLLEKRSARIVTTFDDEYPPLLLQMYAPPPVLWYKGDVSILQARSVAVVGSRAANWYGKSVIAKFLPALVEAQLVIVSGGARGIDTWAHEEALACGGKTVAVLGSGFNHSYPIENEALFEQIVDRQGVLISSFACDIPPVAGNFPARNTIIAGMTHACLVVQAAEKSGALITARHVLEFGRDLFVVPGAITDPLMAGCHALIGQGAAVAYDVNVLLEQFGFSALPKRHTSAVNQIKEAVTDDQKSILSLCAQPTTIEQLQAKTLLPEIRVRELLFELHIEGKVAQNHMGFWQTQ